MSVSVERLLAGTADGRPLNWDAHIALHGELPRVESKELVEELARARLTGRGGAGFPTARKLSLVAAQRGAKVLVANAAETEPMSQKDRVLLELAPHLVLDGLELTARAIGAKTQILALGARASYLRPRLDAALRDRRSRDLTIVELPDRYLAGQETALVHFVNGGPVMPRLVPPYPAEQGVRRRPTLIQNAETFAHIALIARHGARWFHGAGTETSPGTILVSVAGAVDEPGVYEVHGGSPLGDVIDLAGGVSSELRALLVGGYFGTWLGPEVTAMHLDATRLARHGATIGTGVIVALDKRHCPVAEVARVGAWMASQSAHQCGPCSNGLPLMAHELNAIANGKGRRDSRRLLQRWGGLVERRGACHHPDGTARFVLSALEVFKQEFKQHERGGPCELCSAPPALIVPATEALAA